MNRFTIKKVYPISNDYSLVIDKPLCQKQANNKLGRLEDIEEDLGCPLEVFFKILKERNYYFEYNGKVYYNKKCYINIVNLDDGFISVSVSNEELRNKYIFDVKLFFNEHKKIWWLSETKEE